MKWREREEAKKKEIARKTAESIECRASEFLYPSKSRAKRQAKTHTHKTRPIEYIANQKERKIKTWPFCSSCHLLKHKHRQTKTRSQKQKPKNSCPEINDRPAAAAALKASKGLHHLIKRDGEEEKEANWRKTDRVQLCKRGEKREKGF